MRAAVLTAVNQPLQILDLEQDGPKPGEVRVAVKAAGSPFHPMNDKERALWQDMVNQSYNRFVSVVESGRPDLRHKKDQDRADWPLLKRFDWQEEKAGPPDQDPAERNTTPRHVRRIVRRMMRVSMGKAGGPGPTRWRLVRQGVYPRFGGKDNARPPVPRER